MVVFTEGMILVGIELISLTTVIRTTFGLFLYFHTTNILVIGSKVKAGNSLGDNNLTFEIGQCYHHEKLVSVYHI